MISLQNLIRNSNKQISSLQNIFYKEADDIFNNSTFAHKTELFFSVNS